MDSEKDQTLIENFLLAFSNPNAQVSDTLDFSIKRTQIVEDTLNHLVKGKYNLKKELKVNFIGEPA